MIQFDEHIFQMGGWKTTNEFLVFLHPSRLARKHFLTGAVGSSRSSSRGQLSILSFAQLLDWGATDDVRELADS